MEFNPDVLLEHLKEDLSIQDGELQYYQSRVLMTTILKKFVPPQRASSLDAEAKERFMRINSEVSNLDIEFDSFFERWKSRLYDDLMTDDWQTSIITFGRSLSLGRCGPGASIGATDNDFYSKLFCSPVTYTHDFLPVHYSTTSPEHWKKAIVANSFGFVKVLGSRISSVPKDKDRNRTVCVEPSLNMFYQLGAKGTLESVLKKRYLINISYQPTRNKALARLGSRNGKLSTIDLQDASDMISDKLVKYLLPPQVYHVLNVIRSKWTQVDGQFVKLGMFSTMGNGFTFPLMTLLFASMLRVIYDDNNIPFKKRSFGVFGDDIICLTKVYEDVVDRITAAGFKVNTKKSFSTGFFRESCGGDFYHGHNVRGVYLKELTNEADVYSVFNRLHIWSLRTNISLSGTLRYIKGLAKFQPVPRHAGVHEGFILPETLLSSPKRDSNGACIFYRSTCYRSRARSIRDDTINPLGALVSALGGYIVDNRVPYRLVTKKCSVIKKRTPCWDYALDSHLKGEALYFSWLFILMDN